MTASLTATLIENETKIKIKLILDKANKKFDGLVDLGAKRLSQGTVYEAVVDATEEACAPFAAFAEANGLEIVML